MLKAGRGDIIMYRRKHPAAVIGQVIGQVYTRTRLPCLAPPLRKYHSWDYNDVRNIHCESKRDLYTFAHNFGRCWRIFETFSIVEFVKKFATNWLSHCPPHLKRVAALWNEVLEVELGDPGSIPGSRHYSIG